MTPLILRPEPQATHFASLLRQAGHTPVVTPLLSMLPGAGLPELSHQLASAELVIAISAAAVEQADAALDTSGTHWPDKSYLAVGNATAAAWQTCGVSAHYPDDARSEGILTLPELANIQGKPLLILRGNGGREYLAEQLRLRGAIVSYCECYQRHWLALDGAQQFAIWHTAGVDSVMITSGELLNRLLTLLPQSASEWLHNLTLIVPSTRVADLVKAAGLPPPRLAANATQAAMLAALETS